MYDTLFFDLDGVLVDSVPPVQASMNHALVAMGHAPREAAQIRPLVGPPLEESAARLLGDDDPTGVAAFVAHFRDAYRACYLERTVPAPGVHTVLPALAERYRLYVATSKPVAFARPLLEHLGVARWFLAIEGRSLALDHDSKAQVIGRVLARLDAPDPSRILMIGDRSHDVVGARTHGIAAVGVLTGSGDRDELAGAGAIDVLDDLHALERWLGSLRERSTVFGRRSTDL